MANRRSPLVTILAVVAVGLAVFLVNVNRAGPAAVSPARAQAQPSAAAQPPSGAPGLSGAGASPSGQATAGQDAPGTGEVYAGRTAGNEMTLAFATNGTRAAGYVCDGAQVEAWLDGTLDGDHLTLTGSAGSVDAVIDRPTKSVHGTVTAGGRTLPFAAADAAPPSGAYQGRADVRGVTARIGWIVLPDGSQVGVADRGGERGPAPRLEIDGTTLIDGVPATVTPLSPDSAGAPR